MAEVREAVESGRKLSAVARDLNARGVLTKRGRKWTHTQVGNVMVA